MLTAFSSVDLRVTFKDVTDVFQEVYADKVSSAIVAVSCSFFRLHMFIFSCARIRGYWYGALFVDAWLLNA